MNKIPFPVKTAVFIFLLTCFSSFLPLSFAGEGAILANAVMCEGIKEYSPENIAVVFSASLKKISCFTEFDPVHEKSVIFHSWFHNERLTTTKKLFLTPPRWATFSSIQPRNSDKGPWRVEIADKNGKIYHTLRFSITD